MVLAGAGVEVIGMADIHMVVVEVQV